MICFILFFNVWAYETSIHCFSGFESLHLVVKELIVTLKKVVLLFILVFFCFLFLLHTVLSVKAILHSFQPAFLLSVRGSVFVCQILVYVFFSGWSLRCLWFVLLESIIRTLALPSLDFLLYLFILLFFYFIFSSCLSSRLSGRLSGLILLPFFFFYYYTIIFCIFFQLLERNGLSLALSCLQHYVFELFSITTIPFHHLYFYLL